MLGLAKAVIGFIRTPGLHALLDPEQCFAERAEEASNFFRSFSLAGSLEDWDAAVQKTENRLARVNEQRVKVRVLCISCSKLKHGTCSGLSPWPLVSAEMLQPLS